jgi:biotin carboxyl carrier protein
MATTTFTLSNGGKIQAQEPGTVWQGLALVETSSVEVGDSISVGCGFAVMDVVSKVTE